MQGAREEQSRNSKCSLGAQVWLPQGMHTAISLRCSADVETPPVGEVNLFAARHLDPRSVGTSRLMMLILDYTPHQPIRRTSGADQLTLSSQDHKTLHSPLLGWDTQLQGTNQPCCGHGASKESHTTKQLNSKLATSPLVWQSDKAILFLLHLNSSLQNLIQCQRYSMRLDLASGLLMKCHHRYIHRGRGESERHKERAVYMKMQLELRAISQEKIPMRKCVSVKLTCSLQSSAAWLGRAGLCVTGVGVIQETLTYKRGSLRPEGRGVPQAHLLRGKLAWLAWWVEDLVWQEPMAVGPGHQGLNLGHPVHATGVNWSSLHTRTEN